MDQEQIAQDYRRDGVVRVPQLFSAQQVAEIRAEIARYIKDDLPHRPADACTFEADERTVRNLWRLERYNERLCTLVLQASLPGLIARLVQEEPVLCAVETFNKRARLGSGVPPHQDNAYFCQRPPDMLTVWIAIDAVTAENGPVCFQRGSHRLGTLPTRSTGVRGNSIGLADPTAVAAGKEFRALLEPGDATIHHCQTVHSSEPNRSDHDRLALLLVYRGKHTQVDKRLQKAYQAAVATTPPA